MLKHRIIEKRSKNKTKQIINKYSIQLYLCNDDIHKFSAHNRTSSVNMKTVKREKNNCEKKRCEEYGFF